METLNELILSSTPVLVDFYADWCGPCKTMSDILVRVKQKHKDSVRIIKINVDRNKRTAIQYSIQSIPTLMIFKEGKLLWRQSGVIQETELDGVIEMLK